MSGDRDRPVPSDPALVGRVVRPHGLDGDVVIDPSDPGSECFEPGKSLWLGDAWRQVLSSRVQGQRWVVRLRGVVGRDGAEALRGMPIEVDADGLPELESGRYYIHDLVGCRVVDVAGELLGEVVGVVPGPQDWLEVKTPDGRSLVPMVDAVLQEVDIEARVVVIDPPTGLIEVTRG